MLMFIIKQGGVYCEYKQTGFFIDYDKETGLEVLANDKILGNRVKLDPNLSTEELIPLVKKQLTSILICGSIKLGMPVRTSLSILREINPVLPTVVYLVKRKAV